MTRSPSVLRYPVHARHVVRVFWGATATGGARYEVLVRHDGAHYPVVAEHQPPPRPTAPQRRWHPRASVRSPRQSAVVQLYRGRDALSALRVQLHAAGAATNTPVLGEHYCYVLPRGDAAAPVLAPLVPGQLRHNNTLPAHPQVWQVGRSLHHLPQAWHATACPEPRLFGDERSTWAWQ